MTYSLFFSIFLEKGKWNESERYLEVGNLKIKHVIFYGLVTKVEDRGKYLSLSVVDDFGKYEIRTFDKNKLSGINAGDFIVGIGNIRMFRNVFYILPKCINRADPDHIFLFISYYFKRRHKDIVFFEQQKKMFKKLEERIEKAIVETNAETKGDVEEISVENLLKVIKKMDKGNGVSYEDLLELFGKDNEQKLEEIIQQLLLSGLVYEPSPGRLKILE